MTKAVKLTTALPAGHRAILLLSDGQNQPPTQGDPQQAITLAQNANLPVFVIGLGNQIDEPYLLSLANGTGGLFRSTPKSSELASLFTDMASLLKTQYILTYPSSLPADGKSHTLKVTLNTAQGSASTSLGFGPLPVAANTPTPVPPTATAMPAVPTMLPTLVPTPAPERPSFLAENWGWLLAAVIALALASWFTGQRMRRSRPKKEVCICRSSIRVVTTGFRRKSFWPAPCMRRCWMSVTPPIVNAGQPVMASPSPYRTRAA